MSVRPSALGLLSKRERFAIVLLVHKISNYHLLYLHLFITLCCSLYCRSGRVRPLRHLSAPRSTSGSTEQPSDNRFDSVVLPRRPSFPSSTFLLSRRLLSSSASEGEPSLNTLLLQYAILSCNWVLYRVVYQFFSSINGLHPKPRKVLQLLRLRQINNATFVRLNKATVNMLRIAEPYIAYG